MDRQQANITLAYLLLEIIKEEPHLRFGQILQNYGFVEYHNLGMNGKPDSDYPIWINEFYVEPEKVLERVTKVIDNE